MAARNPARRFGLHLGILQQDVGVLAGKCRFDAAAQLALLPAVEEINADDDDHTAQTDEPPEYGSFDEAAAHAAMMAREYTIMLDMGLGRAECRFLTCDLTEEYVRINADYST